MDVNQEIEQLHCRQTYEEYLQEQAIAAEEEDDGLCFPEQLEGQFVRSH